MKGKRYRGGSRSGDRIDNLFRGLVFDAMLKRPMVYAWKGRGVTDWEYLVTSHKAKQIPNKIRYADFEKGFMNFLVDLDWRAIAGEAEPAELKSLQKKLEKVAAEQDCTTRALKRNKKLLDDPDAVISTTFLSSIGQAEKRIGELIAERESITAEMERHRSRSFTITDPGELYAAIDAVRNSIKPRDSSNEKRARLRQEIQKRIRRIDIHFDGREKKIMQADALARIYFVNGVERWISFHHDFPVPVGVSLEK
jgi:hypothetical protein